MLRPGLTADEICARLEKIIARFGVDNVLACADLVIFYSGPSEIVSPIVGPGLLNNWYRSKDMADELHGSRIDDTRLSKSLNRLKLRDHFKTLYATAKNPAREAIAAELKVWGLLSEYFAQASFRHAATAVCGADENRVFRKYELAKLIKNIYLKRINAIRAQAIGDMYTSVNADETFNLICRSELRMIWRIANNAVGKRKDKAADDYMERRLFYKTERQETEDSRITRGIIPLTVNQERQRQWIISKYNLAHIYSDISSWKILPSRHAPRTPRSSVSPIFTH